MITKLFFCLPVRRALFLKTLNHFRSNFSVLAESNVRNTSNSENLFLQFVTTRFNMPSADAAKILKKRPSLKRLKSLGNIQQLVSILNRYGCNDEQIINLIKSQPALLVTSAERVLEPKIQLLRDFGIWRENINEIVFGLPRILTAKLEVLRSNIELLKTVFPTNDLLIRAIRNYYFLHGKCLQKTLKPSLAFWEGFGFHGTELTMFLLIDPRVLRRSSLTPEQLDLIRNIGVRKEGKMYKYVVSMVAINPIEVLQARIDNLQLCGLSQVVRAFPLILTMPEESVKKKLDFMLDHMKLSVDFVAKHSRLFSMSLDKLIRPRLLVLQTIAAINGAGQVNSTRLFSMLMLSEAKFVAQIIQVHSESGALWTVYKNAMSQKLVDK